MERWQTPDEKIAWLDVEKGIQRFGGDRESYMQILRSFAASARSLLDAVRGATEDNLANYAITVHGIKGASRSIFAEITGNMAESLEKAAKAGDFGFVREHNENFIKTVDNLIADIDGIVDKMDSENPKPEKDRPDIETLTELLAACKEYDMDGVDAAMEKIGSFEYKSGGELADWLRTNVDRMNFAQIVERLSSLTGDVEALNGKRP
jgi:HPt (histidine-containing phosphotransfer) domain-containing protein